MSPFTHAYLKTAFGSQTEGSSAFSMYGVFSYTTTIEWAYQTETYNLQFLTANSAKPNTATWIPPAAAAASHWNSDLVGTLPHQLPQICSRPTRRLMVAIIGGAHSLSERSFKKKKKVDADWFVSSTNFFPLNKKLILNFIKEFYSKGGDPSSSLRNTKYPKN